MAWVDIHDKDPTIRVNWSDFEIMRLIMNFLEVFNEVTNQLCVFYNHISSYLF